MRNIKKKRERGMGLTIFLVIQIIICILGIGAVFFLLPSTAEYESITGESALGLQLTLFASAIILLFAVVFSAGVWRWRIWGYWGLSIAYILSILMGIVSGEFGGVVVNLIWYGIFFMVTRNKTHLMDWKL